MAQIPKGRLVKGPYKPICRDCVLQEKSLMAKAATPYLEKDTLF